MSVTKHISVGFALLVLRYWAMRRPLSKERATGAVSHAFFYNKQISVTSGDTSGASLGLGSVAGALGVGGVLGTIAGGVSVGGGTSSSVSTSYAQQRILAIPPQSSAYISESSWYEYNQKRQEWRILHRECLFRKMRERRRFLLSDRFRCAKYKPLLAKTSAKLCAIQNYFVTLPCD